MTCTAGCASLPPPVPRAPEPALAPADASTTPLGRLVVKATPAAATAATAANVSGFRLLVDGQDAMNALIALADHAQRTLDLQYYLIRKDDSSRTIMQHVRAAADRGVQVRLLLDDLNTAGEDEGLLRLTRHPRITVRLFNPLPGWRFSTAGRILASLTDIPRINHRMHNKMFVADNALAVTGGRNLGDAYFLRDKDSNFLDIDLLVAGPAVHDLSHTFDRFWNDPLAYPVEAIVSPTPRASADAATGGASPANAASSSTQARSATTQLSEELTEGRLTSLQWVSAHVMADSPVKLDNDKQKPLRRDEVIHDDIDRLLQSARQQVLIISPYFVPGPHGLALFKALRARGVDVGVLTNSLATTDAPAVHAGYARYRVQLLDMGVHIYELKPRFEGRKPRKTAIGSLGSSRASLHAKVIVIDGQTAVVGSMNLDPRSASLNSEMGVVVHSPAIARQLGEVYRDVSGASYALSLSADHDVQWQTQPPEPDLQGRQEPGASLWLKLALKLLGPFAPDEML
ncbi:MAG: phosphatidylserine/phosphatidylglycerophosphate/cardiolipin synthase family protein [Aquabacterium sp.]